MEYDNPRTSAGLLMYRLKNGRLEVFLVHPGGPYFKGKDKGYWGIPKGIVNENEDLFDAAMREFNEETGIDINDKAKFIDLGFVVKKSGKKIYAWAFENDWSGQLVSNTCETEYPPKSGKMITIPEIDKGEFVSVQQAREMINEKQWAFVERLTEKLK
jgi:predicted NUDIX family NTP pyrophosphohydrolase